MARFLLGEREFNIPMKSRFALIASVASIIGFTQLGLDGQTPAPPPAPEKVELPLGRNCVVSLDPRASRASLPGTENAASGFEADGTLRGQLILLSGEWCVLKDGNAENWIPRDKVLLIRSSN